MVRAVRPAPRCPGRRAAVALAVACGIALAAPACAAQEAGAAASAAAAVEAARDAQRAFESRRRALLPVSYGAGGCDVQIGRWCYWYDETEPHVPREPASIARARERLLATLRAQAAAAPDDAWVAGQRVRYLVEAGRPADAAGVARDCAADPAWCAALLGYALHRAGDAAEADRAFDAALAAMPADSACRWLDPRPLVPDDERAAFGARCTPGDTLVARFWRLATPFLVRGGNDRRSEHLARQVLARLLAGARTPYADRWSADLEEMTVRYGWPDRWSRRRPASHATATVDAIGHEPWPSYRFTPTLEGLLDPRAAPAPLRDRRAYERAAPPAARRVDEMPLAAHAFRRGDSLLVVAVASPPPDAGLARYDSLALAVAPLAGTSPAVRVASVPLSGAVLVARVTTPAAPSLVGLEALGDSTYALRGRAFAAPPPEDRGFGVSDLLVFTAPPDGVLPATLDAAMRAAVPGRVARGATIGVYWEIYGLVDGVHAVDAALFVEPERPGWLARAVARLAGRAPAAAPPRVLWTDVGAGGPAAARAVLVDPGMLAAGRHRLVLELRHPDGRVTRTSRVVVVADR